METISLTSKAVKDVQDFREEVIETLAEHEKNRLQFYIGDMRVENSKIMIDDNELSKDSTKRILSHLRVKNNFLELERRMTEEDWATVANKLKMVNANQAVYGRKKTNTNSVVDLHIGHRKAPNGGIQIPEIFDELIENLLGSSANDYVLSDRYFSEDTGEVSVTLLRSGEEIDVFGSGEDMWKTGKRITWSPVNFTLFPFFERLSCTNGNVSRQYGFGTNVSKSKYNLGKIKTVLESEILHASDAATPMLTAATRHLKKNNVSVREFLQYRSFFDEEEHDHILSKYFDTSYLSTNYRCDVEGMHPIWKSTADTGKNAYDFFNDLTYIASHPNEIKLEEEKRRELQIKASDILFKEVLDLELIAPKITSWKK